MTPTTEYAVGFSAGATACTIIFERLYRLFREARNGNGESGKRPTAYWVAKFDALDGHAQRQTEILGKQTELLQKQSETLVELLTITKMQAKL